MWHNGYFAGKKLKKLRLRGRQFTHIFKGGGGKNSTFSKNILPWFLQVFYIFAAFLMTDCIPELFVLIIKSPHNHWIWIVDTPNTTLGPPKNTNNQSMKMAKITSKNNIVQKYLPNIKIIFYHRDCKGTNSVITPKDTKIIIFTSVR